MFRLLSNLKLIKLIGTVLGITPSNENDGDTGKKNTRKQETSATNLSNGTVIKKTPEQIKVINFDFHILFIIDYSRLKKRKRREMKHIRKKSSKSH